MEIGRPTKINKTAYFGLILLALVTAGCLDNGNNQVTTSPAISPSPGWSLTTIPNASLSSVTYGAGKFVAVGSRIAYSDDGEVWSFATGPSPSGYDRLYDVTFGNGVFVAVGYKWDSSRHGVVFVSSDALEWVEVTPAPNPGSFAGQSSFPNHPLQLNSVAYANGQFLAVGNLGTTLVSNDGRIWRDVTVSSADPGNPFHTANSAAIDSYDFSSIAYMNGMFFASGYWVCPSNCHGLGLAPYGARLFSSTDGNTWSFIPQGSLANPHPRTRPAPWRPMATSSWQQATTRHLAIRFW